MSLKVYKASEANRQYENSFFRVFQATLRNLFEQQGLDGVLIGYPKVFGDDALKPDCVLVTKNRVVIVDFKNYADMEIYLPSEAEFESSAWRTSAGVVVKGGSDLNANPFAQLKKQRARLENLVGRRLNEDAGGVGCVVLFQGDVTIKGEVPRRHGNWFAVADEFNFGDVIFDMIDVRSREENDPESLRKEFFKANSYLEKVPVINPEAYALAEESNRKLEEARRERDAAKEEYEKQKRENQRLRERGDSVEEGIRKVREKEKLLAEKEAELEDAQAEFDEKRNAYEIAVADFEKEAEKAKQAVEATKQAAERTKQTRLEREAERERTLQAQAQAKAAADELKRQELVERRKKIWGIFIGVFLVAAIVAAMGFSLAESARQEATREAERRAAAEAVIEDKKSGKTCVELDELAEYMGIPNVCVEYVVGDISSNSTWIYLNRTKNTDFAVLIRKEDGLISVADAKARFLNKRVRARGTIRYYDSEKYKYHEIIISDLSQVEVVE